MSALTATDIYRRLQHLYTRGSWARRMMIYGRPYICPFEELIERVPQGATLLDVGCGDGLFLNVLGHLGKISKGIGFDNNAVAIGSAQAASANCPDSIAVDFVEQPVGERWPEGHFDVVSLIDVLHHIPPSDKRGAVEEAVGHVGQGGLFLFKDIGIKPRWRRFFNSLHDLVLTGDHVTYTPLDDVVSWVESAGMREIERRTINRWWYGHELVLFSKNP